MRLTRFGWSVLLGLVSAALVAGLWLAGVFSAPVALAPAPAQDIRLPTADGKDVLVWSCAGAAPETDARAAMAAFETGLAAITTRTAAEMHAAMTAADAKGEVPADLPEIEARGETEARALVKELEAQFACRLESF